MEKHSNTAVIEKLAIDSQIISTCLVAVGEVLKVSTGTDVVYSGDGFSDCPNETQGFQGKIILNADWWGEIIVAVPYSLATQLAAKFVGCDPASLSETDVGEGVGEIANQIAGRVATLLTRENVRMGISIPEVTETPSWHLPPSDSHTVLSFRCIDLPFLLIISAVCYK